MTSDLELLHDYARNKSETTFAALVSRHMNLVYSAALRQVRSPQLAEEVVQTVFVDLSQSAAKLRPDTILTAWLYQVTRRTAIDVVRRESRRQLREQVALEMNAMNAAEADWRHIEPLLDDAMAALDETDRSAVLLRYFENKNLREVGEALGASEDAAQKRVSRAVERLREFFAERGVTVGASGLAVVISANAVQAAPVGLALTISTAAALTGTTLATTATITATKALAMTALQKTIVTAFVAASMVTPLLVQHQAVARARAERSDLLTHLRDLPVKTTIQSSVADTENRAAHEREDLERLRRESAILQSRISELSTQAQRLAVANPPQEVTGTPIVETLRLAEMRDAGQATPAALLQTYTWAMLHGDTNRLSQLMSFDPETDMLIVQRKFEEMHKEAAKGMDTILADAPLSEIRLLQEQPAENNDRWVVHEFVTKDGNVAGRARIRVRPAEVVGWKLVIGLDGQPDQETIGEPP